MGEAWDTRFLDLARHVAAWSKDPSTKVGAVIARPDKTVASVGFNGLPRRVTDSADRLTLRPIKYAMTVHAELNAILHAREPLHGYTLYVVPLHPCSNCAAAIIQAGISRIVCEWVPQERWAENFALAGQMLDEAGVKIELRHVGCS